MAELLKTPLAEVRWCKLVGPARDNKFDPSKPSFWSTDLVLENDNKTHREWVEAMEAKYEELHGDTRKSNNWLPIVPDKDEPQSKSIAKFKLNEFTRKDGTTSEGPTLFDSKRNPWPDTQLIGNGSKLIIAFEIWAWKSPSGGGLSFQPRMAQVVDLIPFQNRSVNDMFEEVKGGYELEPPF
jgi:hypothetical protein